MGTYLRLPEGSLFKKYPGPALTRSHLASEERRKVEEQRYNYGTDQQIKGGKTGATNGEYVEYMVPEIKQEIKKEIKIEVTKESEINQEEKMLKETGREDVVEYLDIKPPELKKVKLEASINQFSTPDKSPDCSECGAGYFDRNTNRMKHCYMTLNHTCNGLFCFLSHEDIEKALQNGVFDPEGLSKKTRLVYFDPDLMKVVMLVCQDCNREWILRNIDPTEQRDRMRRRKDWPPETLELIQSIEKFRNLADQV